MYVRFLTMSPYLCLPGALKTRINCSLSIKRKKKKRSQNHHVGTRERRPWQCNSQPHNQRQILLFSSSLGQQHKNANVPKYLSPYKHGLGLRNQKHALRHSCNKQASCRRPPFMPE